MVIVHVTAPAAVGGLERVVEALATGHAGLGHEVHVVAVVDREEDAAGFLAPFSARGVQTHAILAPGRAYLRERAAVRALFMRLRPDVVHTHGYRPDVLDAGVARRLGIATATTVHGFSGCGWKNRAYEALQVRAFRRFGAVVVVSRPLADQLRHRGVDSARLRTIVNAWSPRGPLVERATARRMLGLPAGGLAAVWLGRLSREKGADVALEAIARLPDVPVQLSVVGEGREREALVSRASALGIAHRVRWHGEVPDAGSLLAAFDVFVLSSRTEGTPIALFEAIGAGVPVVATAVGGVPDVVAQASALLVPPDDPKALAAAVRVVLEDQPGAQRRALAARHHLASRYSIEPWLAAYEGVYLQIAGKGRKTE